MPMLKTDDEARNVPSVWLGPPDVIRWPFDASFTQWVVGFILAPILWFFLGFVVPVGLWVTWFGWVFPRNLSKKFPRKTPALIRNPWFFRSWLILLVLLVYLGNPLSFFLPVNPFAAAPLACVAAFVLVRKVSPWLKPSTPVMYWFGVLVDTLKRPRERGVSSYTMNDAVVSSSEEDEGFDLGDLDDYRPKLSLTKKV